MRALTADQTLAIDADVVRLVYMARLDFVSGIVAAHSAVGSIEYAGDEYLGVGQYGGISTVGEGAELERRTVTLTLSGIPGDTPDLVQTALAENYQGRDARIYLALLDEGYQLIGEPRLTFRGRIDTCSVQIGQTASVSATIENRLADWDRARITRYTHQDQQAQFPGDLGLEFVSQMTDLELRWGIAD